MLFTLKHTINELYPKKERAKEKLLAKEKIEEHKSDQTHSEMS